MGLPLPQPNPTLQYSKLKARDCLSATVGKIFFGQVSKTDDITMDAICYCIMNSLFLMVFSFI